MINALSTKQFILVAGCVYFVIESFYFQFQIPIQLDKGSLIGLMSFMSFFRNIRVYICRNYSAASLSPAHGISEKFTYKK